MNILLVTDNQNLSFLCHIESFVRRHVTTFLKINEIKKIKFDDIDNAVIKNFDILITSSVKVVLELSKQYEKPIFFLSNNNIFTPDMYNIDKILVTDYNIDFKNWFGVEKEKIIHIPLNIHGDVEPQHGSSKKTKVGKIAYFPHKEDLEYFISRKVVSALNSLLPYNVTIYVDDLGKSVLENISNVNISFNQIEDDPFLLNDYDLIIGSTNVAIKALKNNTPFFVIGNHGLGGLVDTSNLADYIRTDFKGRIGGVPYEDVPITLLRFMLEDAILKVDLGLTNGTELVDKKMIDRLINFSNSKSLERMFFELKDTNERFSLISNEEQFPSLYVKLLTSVTVNLNTENEGSIISGLETGKILAMLGKEETLILQACTIGKYVYELHSQFSEFDKQDIDSLLNDFFLNQIVRFYNISPEDNE